MLKNHPRIEDFAAFLRNPSGPGTGTRNAQILLHLVAECPTCRDRLHGMGWSATHLERLVRFPVDRDEQSAAEGTAPYDYSQAFARTEQALSAFFAQGAQAESTPEELLAELAPLPQDEQVRWVTTYSRFANQRLVHKLMEMSHAVRYENPARMLHLAHLARLAADACTAAVAGSASRLADLRALGWRQYANALRVSGRLREAEEAFAAARRFCDEGTGDPPLRAALLARMVSLRIAQRRFEEAVALAGKAGDIYRELGDKRSVAPVMVQKAMAQLLSGAPEPAVRTLNRTIPLIDPESDPYLLLVASHNLIRAYIEMGEPEQALSLYLEVQGLYRGFQDSLIALRAGWQEGQILRDLGHLQAAEAALLQARHGFQEKALFYEVALVSLDLSEVYLRLGKIQELHAAVAEMVPVFKVLEVDREMLAALLQLQQANQQSREALELIRFLSSRLEELPDRQNLK